MVRKQILGIILVAGLLGFALTDFARSLQAGEKWQLTDVAGHLPNLRFSLVSDGGQRVTERNYRGDVAILYFGFTGCGAECPLTMTRLGHILQQLGKEADHVHVLFVTLDPGNDTPDNLRRYLAPFDTKHIAGLTGNTEDIALLAKRYRVAYHPGYGNGGAISHGNVMYIFDTHGRTRLIVRPDDSDEALLSDVRRLIHDAV